MHNQTGETPNKVIPSEKVENLIFWGANLYQNIFLGAAERIINALLIINGGALIAIFGFFCRISK